MAAHLLLLTSLGLAIAGGAYVASPHAQTFVAAHVGCSDVVEASAHAQAHHHHHRHADATARASAASWCGAFSSGGDAGAEHDRNARHADDGTGGDDDQDCPHDGTRASSQRSHGDLIRASVDVDA